MVANAEAPCIIEAAFAVESNIALKQDGAEAHRCGFFQRVVQQALAVALTLAVIGNTDRTHCQHGDLPAVIGEDICAHEHVLPDQSAVLLHHEIQFMDECRVITEHMHHIMLAAPRTVHIPERFTDELLNGSLVFGSLRTDDIVICIHCFTS